MNILGAANQQAVNRVVLSTVNTVAPVITGDGASGTVMTSTDGTWTGTVGGFSYQWQSDGVDISGAIASTYTVTGVTENTDLTLDVTNNGVTATSNTVNSTPVSGTVNTVAPVITGIGYDGQTMTCTSDGTWTGVVGGYTYQWQADGVNISGATAATYVVTRVNEGKAITCNVINNAVTAPSNTIHNWVPSDSATTMEFWIDASNTASLTLENTNQVSVANDLSGKLRHAGQTVAGNRPTNDGALNGKAAFNFSLQYLKLTSLLPSSASTWVFIGKRTSNYSGYFGATDDYIPLYLNSTSTQISKIETVAHFDAATPRKMLFGGEASQTVTDRNSLNLPTKEKSIMVMTADTSISTKLVDVGRGAGSDIYKLTGTCGEALIYSGQLSAGDIVKMQGYAAHKWNFVAELGTHAHDAAGGAPTV